MPTAFFVDDEGKDPRNTYEDWARTEEWAKKSQKPVDAVYEKYAATGRLLCPPGFPTTANLVIKNDVIVGAAHAFYDENGKARFEKPPKVCKFHVMKKSGDQDWNEIYDVDLSTLQVGTKNWHKQSPDLDWAVVKLKKPVKDVQAYQVDPNAGNPHPDYKGLAVSAGQKDRKVRSGDRVIRRPIWSANERYNDTPNLIHRCGRSGTFGTSLWVTNCSLGERGSGSALLVDSQSGSSDEPLFISAIGITIPPANDAGYRYNPQAGVATGYLAITGKFQEALLAAAK